MKELLLVMLGWLGYLERPGVALQLLLTLLLALLFQLPRLRRFSLPAQAGSLLPIVLALLISLILQACGWPSGLIQTLTLLWLGWMLLDGLEGLLARLLPAQRVRDLLSHLLRPCYLVAAVVLLVSELDSLEDLAVIPLGRLFGAEINLGKLCVSLLAFYLLLIGSGPPSAGLAWLVQRLIGISEGSRKAMELVLRYSVVGIGIAALAYQLGLNGNALLAVAGGLSVGLGFGIKEVFSNFVSGIWLLFEGSVRPGEVLMVDGDPCEVRRLGLRATLLWRDRDNAELLIPNQTFFTETATTYTATDRMRRSQVSVGAAYRHPPAEVIALLEATALTVPRVLREPAPKALLLNYGDSAINYALRFWIANPMDNVGICSEVNQAIWTAFDREGIEIPYPQQVQHQPAAEPPASSPGLGQERAAPSA
jgi:potassium efflux system protein